MRLRYYHCTCGVSLKSRGIAEPTKKNMYLVALVSA